VHHSKFGGQCLSWVRSVELVLFATFPLNPEKPTQDRTSFCAAWCQEET
jgi:hypothetical protein